MRSYRALRIQRALEDLHLRAHFRGGLITEVPVFFQRTIENALQLRRQIGIQLQRRHRLPIQDALENNRRGVAVEGLLAGGHLIERRSKRKQVGAAVEFLAPGLLRRHIGDGAQGAARTGEVARGLVAVGRDTWVAAVVELRQPKIQQLRLAVFGDEDIRRLDVAMDDALGMRRIERVGNLNSQVEQEVDRQRLAVDAMLERLPLEKLHREKGAAVVFANVVDRADIRMIEGRSGAGFAPEALQHRQLAADLVRQKLERHKAPQAGVFSLVDHPHPATADFFEHPVVGDSFTNHS